ncbi:YtxH domain-containing protein [Actinoplanes subtropicus]|uniref:YtxH domain-containing protein n=1 Tax=Actinoplanes subtropicus TaxID=543632 RepID=UPI00054DD39A|nr:YtxH domain-containing protein [Actinoplanes subtropicus]
MRIVKFAAGFAAGYVLGSKAGREKYEQIAEAARRMRGNPTVQQAQHKAKDVVGAGVDTAKAKMDRRRPRPKPVEPVEPVDLTSPV